MSDLFLSYASEDRERVRVLADALGGAGYSVWWDRKLAAGRTYIHEISKALRAARCVLVLWSRASLESDWVLEEATNARSRKVLLPVLLEDVRPPLGFATLHAADLTAWNGDTKSEGFRKLLDDITLHLNPGAMPAAPGRAQPAAPAAARPGALPPAQRVVLELLRGKPDVRWTAELIVVSLHEKRSIVPPPASEIRSAISALVESGYLHHDSPTTLAVTGKTIEFYRRNPRGAA